MPEPGLALLKFGGSICREARMFALALDAVTLLARRRRLVVLPGGGEFADRVRLAQSEHGFSDDTAHWMAILAMEQVGYLIADSLGNARLVRAEAEIALAHDARQVPVFAPYQWLRADDPVPHSWDATSDSIAAALAGHIGASELILLKPVMGPVETLVDPAFASTCPAGLRVSVATPATLADLAH